MELVVVLCLFYMTCDCYKILALFPDYGRSHHIYFSSLMEELALRNHDVTVLNYYPMKNLSTLHQIRFRLNNIENGTQLNTNKQKIMSGKNTTMLHRTDAYKIYNKLLAYKKMANIHCRRLVENRELQNLVKSATHFDVVVVEQFVSDCGLAIAHMLNAPAIGMTAHILFPWTYSRLGVPVNPSYVQNYFFACGSKSNVYKRIKSTIINLGANFYYRQMIQRSDQAIINEVYPEAIDLEALGRKMALIMVNQYYPLTGSRLYGANVVEIGGMHINKSAQKIEQDLKEFLDTADSNGIVYISFGSIASDIPQQIIDVITILTQKSNMKFIWKLKISNWMPPKNVFLNSWLPQVSVLCHPNVKAFVSHSGMLSISETIHCGVPVVGVPLFSDQFANAQAVVENGLGVMVDSLDLDENVLENALKIVLQDSYQRRAKEFSRIWRDRPMSPMDTAVFWIEHVSRHKGAVKMRPPTVELPLYQHLMLDVLLVLTSLGIAFCFVLKKALYFFKSFLFTKDNVRQELVTKEIVNKKDN